MNIQLNSIQMDVVNKVFCDDGFVLELFSLSYGVEYSIVRMYRMFGEFKILRF